jgi:hypothetical protein
MTVAYRAIIVPAFVSAGFRRGAGDFERCPFKNVISGALATP